MAPDSAYAVAILGNSITDGRGSGTNKQDRWPDELARRLQANPDTRQVAVLNEGIRGNCVLHACLGPSAVSRFERDVLSQNGVKWLIILEGINDIGGANGSQGSAQVAQDLIAAFGQMIDSAHAKGILVYGATSLPFGGSSYDSPDHQTAWQTGNDWIRHSGRFDAVIDLDSAMHDPANSSRLLPIYDSGDHLHPSEAGHHMMAEAVNLGLFSGELRTGMNEESGIQSNAYSLSQNFPNPFNPVTTIKYSIPRYSYVSLKVFDVLGNEVANLVHSMRQAGDYVVSFNGNGLSSGICFYRLSTNTGYMQTKKLLLLR